MIICNFFFPSPCPHPAQQPVHDGMSSSEPEVTAETLGPDDRSPRAGSNFSWHSSWLKWMELYGRLNLPSQPPPSLERHYLWSVSATILLSTLKTDRWRDDTHKERQLKDFIYFKGFVSQARGRERAASCGPFPDNPRPRAPPNCKEGDNQKGGADGGGDSSKPYNFWGRREKFREQNAAERPFLSASALV